MDIWIKVFPFLASLIVKMINDNEGKIMTVFFINFLRYFHTCISFTIEVLMEFGLLQTFQIRNERVAEHECQKREKTKEDQTEIQHAAYVEAEISVIDVRSVCDMADRF